MFLNQSFSNTYNTPTNKKASDPHTLDVLESISRLSAARAAKLRIRKEGLPPK